MYQHLITHRPSSSSIAPQEEPAKEEAPEEALIVEQKVETTNIDDLEDIPLVTRIKQSPKKVKSKSSRKNSTISSPSPSKPKVENPVETIEEIIDEEDIPLAKRQKLSESSSPQAEQNGGSKMSSKRPDRRCKSTANTLVAMLTADELYEDLDLRNKKANSKGQQQDSQTKFTKQENNSEETAKKVSETEPLNSSSKVSKASKATAKAPTKLANGLKKAPAKKSSKKKVVVKATTLASKTKNNANQKTKDSKNKNSKPKAKTKATKKKVTTTKKNTKRKSSRKQPQIPKPMIHSAEIPSRRSSINDAEKIGQVVQVVTEENKTFFCLKCSTRFSTFADLNEHKKQLHQDKPKFLLNHKVIQPSPQHQIIRMKEECSPDLAKFVANAVRQVPETTFNNMHGRLKDIGTEDGKLYLAKNGQMGTVEKVKMNVSEVWTSKEVYESGWEVAANDSLRWQKYDQQQPQLEQSQDHPHHKVLMKMSHLSWSEQRQFQNVFNSFSDISSASNTSLQELVVQNTPSSLKFELSKKVKMIQGLDLKQLEKRKNKKSSNKISLSAGAKHTINNGQAKLDSQLSEYVADGKEVGNLNGEWENAHDFMCSTCAIVYDELREVLHHKWEAHPYCLVAHVTLRRDLTLPPSDMMYPQLGRSLTKHKSVKLIGSKKPKPEIKPDPQLEHKCSKCPELKFEGGKEEFYAHVLECGGDVDWDVSKKKKKKKKLVNPESVRIRNETPGKTKPTLLTIIFRENDEIEFNARKFTVLERNSISRTTLIINYKTLQK